MDCIDGVVEQVGDHLSHQQRVRAYVDCVRGLTHGELDFLGSGARPSHPEGASHELVEVDGVSRERHPGRGSLRQAAKNGDGVVGGAGRSLEAVAVDGVEAAGVDLAEITQGISHVVTKVVYDALDGTAVNKGASGVG